MVKLLIKKKKIILVILGVMVVGGLISQIRQIGLISKPEVLPEVTETVIKITSTPAPPTPTPTLTSKQKSEVRKQSLLQYNAKYGPCRWLPILTYHHVMPAADAKAIGSSYLNVPPEIFRQQVDYLLGKGYSLLRLDEMMNSLRGGSLPAKPIVLTFDDAYRDFYDIVYPILREKNVKATLFVISQFVGGERYVNWQQVSKMSDSGLVLIGDHTLNHPSLLKQTREEEFNQIVSAKKVIEEKIGKNVEYFAYPYGSANQTAKEILKENGFLGAVVTTNNAPVCAGLPYELSRIRIGATSMQFYGL